MGRALPCLRAAALVAILAGMVVGTLAGLAGGLVDEVLMRIVDAFQIVPGFLLALAFVSVIGPSLPIVVLAIALGVWTAPARLARAEVLSIRERDYVAAARVIGMHPVEIALREVLPNAAAAGAGAERGAGGGGGADRGGAVVSRLGDPNIVTWAR